MALTLNNDLLISKIIMIHLPILPDISSPEDFGQVIQDFAAYLILPYITHFTSWRGAGRPRTIMLFIFLLQNGLLLVMDQDSSLALR